MIMLAVAAILPVAAGEAAVALSLIQRHANKVPSSLTPCVVFHSQHKSGGRQVENLLGWVGINSTGVDALTWRSTENCKFRCDAEQWDCQKQSCSMDDYFCDYPGGAKVAMAGYALTLSGSREYGSPGDGRCLWVTVSREPVARLVSAYLYCKNVVQWDPLCGNSSFAFETGTIQDFAKHWGNFLFREMMWDDKLHALAKSRPDFKTAIKCGDEDPWEPWLQFKNQLNGGDDPRTESGSENFKAVKRRLDGKHGEPSLYDVIGVVERWNESMALFNDYLPLASGREWLETTANGGVVDHGSSQYQDEEEETLKIARKDKVVLKHLAGDIELYNDIILPKFESQFKGMCQRGSVDTLIRMHRRPAANLFGQVCEGREVTWNDVKNAMKDITLDAWVDDHRAKDVSRKDFPLLAK